MIVFRSVDFSYGSSPLISDLSFTVEPGQVLALLGPNGSGKTTVGRLALGLVQPTKGTIEVAGCNEGTPIPKAAVFQEDRLVESLSAVGNVLLVTQNSLAAHLPDRHPARSRRPQRDAVPAPVSRNEATNRISSLKNEDPRDSLVKANVTRAEVENELIAAGLPVEHHTKPVSELSGGQRRRVAIARALAHGPEILILDEPFTGIDAETLLQVRSYVKSRITGCATLLITHDETDAAAFGARTVPFGKVTDSRGESR
jgi:ABC-type multidrug transport system ATPase subunit